MQYPKPDLLVALKTDPAADLSIDPIPDLRNAKRADRSLAVIQISVSGFGAALVDPLPPGVQVDDLAWMGFAQVQIEMLDPVHDELLAHAVLDADAQVLHLAFQVVDLVVALGDLLVDLHALAVEIGGRQKDAGDHDAHEDHDREEAQQIEFGFAVIAYFSGRFVLTCPQIHCRTINVALSRIQNP